MSEDEQNRGESSRDTPDPGDMHKPAGKKHLMIFAISDYSGDHGYQALKYPVNDAEELIAALQNEAFEYKFDHIFEPVYDRACTRDKIRETIQLAADVIRPEDQLLVLFAGHGTSSGQNGYWVCADAQKLKGMNLSMLDVVNELISQCACSQTLLVADCCFAGHAVDAAYMLAVHNRLKEHNAIFSILTSCDENNTTPDYSRFMRALLRILKTKNITNFPTLVSDLLSSPEVIGLKTRPSEFSSAKNHDFPFILQRKDNATYLLADSFFDLNYDLQMPHVQGPKLFNMTYLRGTKQCGHNIFTERYFRSNKNLALSMFNNMPPYVIAFGNEAKKPEPDLWKVVGREVLHVENASSSHVLDWMLNQVKKQNVLFLLKIDGDKDTEVELKESFVNFWNDITDAIVANNITPATYKYGVYFFVWDRRGNEESIKNIFDSNDVKCARAACVKLLTLLPVKPLSPDVEIDNWFYKYKNDPVLGNTEEFDTQLMQSIREPYTIENVILQISRYCKRPSIYNILFHKNNNTWV